MIGLGAKGVAAATEVAAAADWALAALGAVDWPSTRH